MVKIAVGRNEVRAARSLLSVAEEYESHFNERELDRMRGLVARMDSAMASSARADEVRAARVARASQGPSEEARAAAEAARAERRRADEEAQRQWDLDRAGFEGDVFDEEDEPDPDATLLSPEAEQFLGFLRAQAREQQVPINEILGVPMVVEGCTCVTCEVERVRLARDASESGVSTEDRRRAQVWVDGQRAIRPTTEISF
jgi:hypothetical protein